jgi:hypothetical protein
MVEIQSKDVIRGRTKRLGHRRVSRKRVFIPTQKGIIIVIITIIITSITA